MCSARFSTKISQNTAPEAFRREFPKLRVEGPIPFTRSNNLNHFRVVAMAANGPGNSLGNN